MTIRDASVEDSSNCTLIEIGGDHPIDADGLSIKRSINCRVVGIRPDPAPPSEPGRNPHSDKGRWIGLVAMVGPTVAAAGIAKALGWA